MTAYGYLGWAALLLILALLLQVARGFSRLTFRLSVVALAISCLIALTCYGLAQRGRPPADFKAAFDRGADDLEQVMVRPLLPGGHRVLPGLPGWIILLVILGAVLVWFDTICTRRGQPSVQVAGAAAALPPHPAGAKTPASRAAVTERLQFQLPAVEVRKPALMPGGSTLENLAAVVSESGVQGSKPAAALLRAIRALEAKPPAYEARLLVETCHVAGQTGRGDPRLQVTVDLRDIRSDQSLAVRILPPCPPAEAAERVAGFTARQVFCHDAVTPGWAVGSVNGEDLSAYLLARQKSPHDETFRACYRCRQEQRELLQGAVDRSPNAGVVQYDLAGLCDLDGDNLESLLLHLDNRLHHPLFLRGRHRLALSLGMLSTRDWFDRQWRGKKPWPAPDPAAASLRQATLRDDVLSALRRCGMISDDDEGVLTNVAGDSTDATATRARLVLLKLAEKEFQDYQTALRPWRLAWSALRNRPERASLLAALRSQPRWWWQPSRRPLASSLSLDIIRRRIACLDDSTAGPQADAALDAAQEKARSRIGFHEGTPWRYGKVPWQAVYNVACLYAQPRSHNQPPKPNAIRIAITLLELAIGDQACELVRPSEWIAIDPDLHGLRSKQESPDPDCRGEFERLVRAQARRDFAPAEDNCIGDPWFSVYLPSTISTAASTSGESAASRHLNNVDGQAGPPAIEQSTSASAGQHNDARR